MSITGTVPIRDVENPAQGDGIDCTVLGALGSAVLRDARLQHSVPVVSGHEYGRESFDHSTFSKNRQRRIEHEIAKGVFGAVLDRAKAQRLLSDEHFTVEAANELRRVR